jgi:hypothetical protein
MKHPIAIPAIGPDCNPVFELAIELGSAEDEPVCWDDCWDDPFEGSEGDAARVVNGVSNRDVGPEVVVGIVAGVAAGVVAKVVASTALKLAKPVVENGDLSTSVVVSVYEIPLFG